MVDFKNLNAQQKSAVTTVNGPVLILAGAGTGKTRVITYRIAYLVSMGVSPENILAVTFTNKAAREMLERARKLLNGTGNGFDAKKKPFISTFHSLGAYILRNHIDKLGYKPNFVIYNESEQLTVIKRILSEIASKEYRPQPEAVAAFISRIKNSAGKGFENIVDGNFTALAERLLKRYNAALKACNAVDFDDLLLLPIELFKKFPDVLNHYRQRFKYIMVDEYQDTNGAQFEMIKLLAGEHRNICVVGDDDQSIYGWRGAELSNILRFEEHFPEAKIVKLEQNYRSTNTILEAANNLISHNTERHTKRLWSSKGSGEKIRLRCFENEEKEAEGIAEWIMFSNKMMGIPLEHHAVLFRTNQQSRPIETALRRAQIPYNLVGGQSFFDRREIRDLVAYLKVFVNPEDDVNLLRITNVPPRGLGEGVMEKLLAASHRLKSSVFSAMRNENVLKELSQRSASAVEEFTELIENARNYLAGKPKKPKELEEFLVRFFKETGYFDDLLKYDKDIETSENRIQNIKDLLAGIDNFEGETMIEKLQSFLSEVTLDSDRENDKKLKPNAVTLITMHSCKGLEFPHVFIAGVEDNLIPHSRSILEDRIDEERRLFYVAITRAMETLTISHCASRKSYGSYTPAHPSRFLKELPQNLLEKEDGLSNKPVSKERAKYYFSMIKNMLGE